MKCTLQQHQHQQQQSVCQATAHTLSHVAAGCSRLVVRTCGPQQFVALQGSCQSQSSCVRVVLRWHAAAQSLRTHTYQSVFASGLRLPIVSAIRLLLDTCCPSAVLSAKKLLLTWMGITAQHGTAQCCN